MESKHLILIVIILLVIVGLIWLFSLLPGLGLGLGGGKGSEEGEGDGKGKDSKDTKVEVSAPQGKKVVILTETGAKYEGSNDIKSPQQMLEELEALTKQGHDIDIYRQKKSTAEIEAPFREAAKTNSRLRLHFDERDLRD
jgi:hypothetical protein